MRYPGAITILLALACGSSVGCIGTTHKATVRLASESESESGAMEQVPQSDDFPTLDSPAASPSATPSGMPTPAAVIPLPTLAGPDPIVSAPPVPAPSSTSIPGTITAGLRLREKFIYLINSSASADTSGVDLVVLDLFDASAAKIAGYKAKGKTVICYFSAGTAENWRSDYSQFPSSAKGKALSGWAGETWLDYRNSSVRSIMSARIKLAQQKGCQGVDPDNIDGHLNDSGFSLGAADQAGYLSYLSAQAHSRGLALGLKNSAETASRLEPYADFAVVEECLRYRECGRYSAFPAHGKPLFQIEYTGKSQSDCNQVKLAGGTLIFSNQALTDFEYCD